MTTSELLERGRAAFDRSAWREAYDALSAAALDGTARPSDLEHRAIAAHMLGGEADAATCWEDAHRIATDAGDVALAIRPAIHVAFTAFSRGEMARGGGWFARAATIIET